MAVRREQIPRVGLPHLAPSPSVARMAHIRFRTTAIPAAAGQDLLTQLLDAGVEVSYLCMAGSCGTCAVRVLAGGEHLEPITATERLRLRSGDGTRRLACQAVCRASGDVVIDQP